MPGQKVRDYAEFEGPFCRGLVAACAPGSDEFCCSRGLYFARTTTQEEAMDQITPTLWINDGKIQEAAGFYCSLFEGSQVTGSNDYGPDAGDFAGQKIVIRLSCREAIRV